jgi:DNA-binding NarL/FixJ family response regulator
MAVRAYLTGRIAIESECGSIVDEAFSDDIERVALTLIVMERRRPVARTEIAQSLWDEAYPDDWMSQVDRALERLASKLNQLRPLLALDVTNGRAVLKSEEAIWVDTENALEALDQALAAMRNGDLERALALTTVAVVIGRRPFLPGVESSWVQRQRDKHKNLLVRGLELLASGLIETGSADEAVRAAEEALTEEPLHEPSLRLLMRALEIEGNRAEAIKAYEEYRIELARQFGTAPSPQTQALAQAMMAPTTADFEVLTPREQEVALLVAEGLTNRAIAKRLFISVQTAETHVKHILTKLGLSSRTQIATWVAARGLTGPT